MDCEPSNGLIARSLQQILENAHLCGELNLTKMKLKEFPNVNKNKYDLCDTTIAGIIIISKYNFSICININLFVFTRSFGKLFYKFS